MKYHWLWCGYLLSAVAAASPMMLAQDYNGQDVGGWLMSEKLDGVRAYWDGSRLISRQGYAFTPPAGFTHNFPPYPLDGELYGGRGRFEATSAAVRAAKGDWSGVKMYVFDVPQASGGLKQRLAVLAGRLKTHPAPNLRIIEQYTVRDKQHAETWMRQIVAQGGEGVILRHPDAPYGSGRSSHYLKLKPQQDAECVVVRHHEGKGKYQGKLGSLTCRNETGEFKIGSGFKDADRSNPPPVGSTITYRYRGFTAKGLPRFATYLRIRSDR
ncbi:DNA ligase [Neisseria leonii]|uniref:DNA ligase n=1 Tax=Neisseria leonii TaxID=2995413 RepID=A0A9X4E1I9_9NEIS|nr:DNA ligase [Neisseria sp. 51.81]MDD9327770.1 DNA ligase [Neisseria sp. 51.81]